MEILQLFAALNPRFAMFSLTSLIVAALSVVWLNGGVGAFVSVPAAIVACTASSALAFFMLGARWNREIRGLVLRSDASIPHVVLGLDFVGWVAALLAVGFFATAVSLSEVSS